jgi:hypothetical protein
MQLSRTVASLRSIFGRQALHLQRLATAGAILTCIAIVLNVGPFAKIPKIAILPETGSRQPSQTNPEQSVASVSMAVTETDAPKQPDHPRPATEAENVDEPSRPSVEPGSSVSAVEFASAPSQPAAAVLVAQPPADSPNPDVVKRASIVGVWAPDTGTCSARDFREGMLPAVINTEGAWAGDTLCLFERKKQMEAGWLVVAKCSNPRGHWTANVRLTVDNNRLTWTSKRGTQVYTRCAPDLLMAEAN